MLSSVSNPFKLVKITTVQIFCQGRMAKDGHSLRLAFLILLIALLDRGLCPFLYANEHLPRRCESDRSQEETVGE